MQLCMIYSDTESVSSYQFVHNDWCSSSCNYNKSTDCMYVAGYRNYTHSAMESKDIEVYRTEVYGYSWNGNTVMESR